MAILIIAFMILYKNKEKKVLDVKILKWFETNIKAYCSDDSSSTKKIDPKGMKFNNREIPSENSKHIAISRVCSNADRNSQHSYASVGFTVYYIFKIFEKLQSIMVSY